MKHTQESPHQWAANFSDSEVEMPQELTSAFIGLIYGANGYVACYDYIKAIDALERLNFNEIEAIENLETYIARSIDKNSKAPLFLNKYERV